MTTSSLQSRLLLGRFLTRSGDQAWDFAVPLVLIQLFPDQIRIAALYFFLSKLLNVLILPKMTSLIDKLNRMSAAKVGISMQLAGVLIGAIAIFQLSVFTSGEWNYGMMIPFFAFGVLVFSGVLSSLGSAFMDIAIANDLVPSSLPPEQLAKFNSRLRQTDLFTEVTSPVLAGLLLTLYQPVLIGFFLVVAWNVLSFFPELQLIRSVLNDRPDLKDKKVIAPALVKKSIFEKLTEGWRNFFKHPIALVAIAYAFLWLSVLSPHGVLLAGYLKDGWRIPEWLIGLFRGSGAIFGLLATVIFPWAERRWGLIRASRNFIAYQSLTLVIALGFFLIEGSVGQFGFLIFILLSRVGLYGFSLGEMQIRQITIAPEVRGELNGFASALTGIATLGLYGAGAALPSTEDFKFLIFGSVLFVAFGCLTFIIWISKNPSRL